MTVTFTEDMTLKERQLAFLEEMVAYYSEDVSRRSFDENEDCYYRHPDGIKRCAIGRYISDERYSKALENKTANFLFANVIRKDIEDLGLLFLRNIQSIHDNNFYWDEDGLSRQGLDIVNRMRQRIKLGW